MFKHKFDPAIDEISALQHCSSAHMDVVSSIGERLSNKIMASYLRDHGVPTADVPADNLLLTTSEHGGALPLLEETRSRMQPRIATELAHGNVPCVTGFIGSTLDGKTTTLGRGGFANGCHSQTVGLKYMHSSDLTAAVLANVLDAEEVILSKAGQSPGPGAPTHWHGAGRVQREAERLDGFVEARLGGLRAPV